MIWLRAELADRDDGMVWLEMTVRDTGCGISKEEQQKIFENYYTAAEKGKHKGAGIGLALTKSLVQLHKGKISVESNENEGALFTASLNVSREAYAADQINEVPAEENSAVTEKYARENSSYLTEARTEIQNREARRSLILIVEDNHEMSEFVRRIFERDFDTAQACDGLSAYETAVQTMPDLIISDVMMPEMDGLELTRKLKSEFTTSHIPVVMLTAKSDEFEKIEGFEYGADAYIEKPFNPQRLELQVRNLLNTRNSTAQRFKNDTKFDSRKLTKNPYDEKFLNNIVKLIMTNLDNDNFSVEDITDGLGVSRTVLHIKLKNLTDLSATEFIRNIRMKEAREKMLEGMNVSEASFAVGMSDPNYFTKCFKKQFGQTPSDFIRTLRKQ
jgi:DNA-binding response OmpR family regulator